MLCIFNLVRKNDECLFVCLFVCWPFCFSPAAFFQSPSSTLCVNLHYPISFLVLSLCLTHFMGLSSLFMLFFCSTSLPLASLDDWISSIYLINLSMITSTFIFVCFFTFFPTKIFSFFIGLSISFYLHKSLIHTMVFTSLLHNKKIRCIEQPFKAD